jgi:large subunit ribosomal protein L24
MACVRQKRKQVRYAKAPHAAQLKPGGVVLVSKALVKDGVSNLVPKIHVKRGDLVMLMSGSKKAGRGQTGKVLKVFPKAGKIIVEGINVVTRARKQRSATDQGGLTRKEAPIFASRVMLFDSESKKPVRASKRKSLSL